MQMSTVISVHNKRASTDVVLLRMQVATIDTEIIVSSHREAR
jgi:hypothetical protein